MSKNCCGKVESTSLQTVLQAYICIYVSIIPFSKPMYIFVCIDVRIIIIIALYIYITTCRYHNFFLIIFNFILCM